MLHFCVAATIEDGVFRPVGNDGWYPRGGSKAAYGQQPLEAAGLVDASLVAYASTGDTAWRTVAEIAHSWYLGNNSNGLSLVEGSGCGDGLEPGGVNRNQGAESTLSYLMSAMAMATERRRPCASRAETRRRRLGKNAELTAVGGRRGARAMPAERTV